jgi:prepilin-type N-terminal cleavage/methylation domain-containing protein/prepilin-type processing-associated H-X9-DG protein
MPSVRYPRSRRGFTLVELLVVITIIALLIGLLLPAIQGAREGSRRAVCQNNQYNLAFAVIRHADQNGFVPGWQNTVRLTAGGTSIQPWPVMITPFIERTDIWRAATGTASWTPPFVSTFVCPSSPTDSQTDPWLAYAGNCGGAGNFPNNLQRFEGVMLNTGTNSGRLTMDEIASADGTSFTCLLSEKCGPGTPPGTGTPASPLIQAFWTTPIASFSDGNTMRAAFGITGDVVPTGKIINSGTAGAPGFWSQPSSNHPGGAVAAFCDGHTEFFKESLRASVYAQLLSWDDESAPKNGSYGSWRGNYSILSEGDFK